jgi:hypothetical protein
MKKIHLRFGAITLIVLLASLSRLIPHPANFAPLGAMALFGTAYYNKRWLAYLLPIVTFWGSDLLVNNILYGDYFDHFVLWYPGAQWTYGTMLLIVLAGTMILKKVTAGRLMLASLSASAIFFLASNFGVWLSGSMYSMDFSGLMTCYAMGLPFFKNTICGDFVYCGVMFGAFELAQRYVPALKPVTA